MGYDVYEDIEWVQLEAADAMAAVISGEVDYASVGTSLAHPIKNNPDVKVVFDHADITPQYSCCRMETDSDFIEEKPNTTKALLKALLRGMHDVHKDPEAAIATLAEELDTPVEFVEAYALDDGYEISPDPLYNSSLRAWDYLNDFGLLDETAANIDLKQHVHVDLYKEALDEVIAEVGDEDPEYWQGVLDYFEENNSQYYEA